MKRLFFLLLVVPVVLKAQQPTSSAANRALVLKANEQRLLYPFLKGSTSTGVLPVENVTFPFVHKGSLRLVYDFTQPTTDPAKGEINQGLEEIVRQLNLQAVTGAKNISAYIVFHGGAAQFLTNNETYRKKFNMDNPNLPLVKQLMDKGVKFVVCGQTLELRGMKMENFPENIQKAYSARSALADLQSRDFILFEIAGDH